VLVDDRPVPIVLAPLAGGPSTPALAAAVSGAGGLGFLGAGYLPAGRLAQDIAATRELTGAPFGVNLFVPGPRSDPAAVAHYAELLAHDAARLGTTLGEPRWSDDEWDAKLDVLTADPVAVVSFTFGVPDAAVLHRLHDVGSEVWVTVTSLAEAELTARVGADVLVVQGLEAGGHRGGFMDSGEPMGLLALLQVVSESTDRPLVGTGGIATGAGVAAVLAAGARAAALGSAFLRCSEAGTSDVHRDALRGRQPTALTRAFTGRTARGIRNRLMAEHPDAPPAYPEVHYLTAPLRQAGREAGDSDVVNLWAGQAYPLGLELPAAELVHRLHVDARAAAARVTDRLGREVP
jgi:nitronate monooxygenase